MSELIGWARVSTADQNLDSQIDELKKAGCKKIFFAKVSGAKEEIKELQKAIEYMRPGDTLVVTKLSRLHRSMLKGIRLLDEFKEKKVSIKTLKDGVDTSTKGGEFIYVLLSLMAEWDRENIRENTRAGLLSARKRGKVGGRRRILTQKMIEEMVKMSKDINQPIAHILKIFGIAERTYHNYLKEYKDGVLWFQDGYEEFKKASRETGGEK